MWARNGGVYPVSNNSDRAERPFRHGSIVRRLAATLALSIALTSCASAPPPTTASSSPVVSAPAPAPHHAAKAQPIGPYSIHLLSNKNEMELAGDMPEGTSAAIRKMLDANPAIHVIHLNSDGGELREGYLLAELIQQRHLTTYTSTVCASACTVAFLAGSPRYVAEDAWLGFHSSSDEQSGEASKKGNAAFYKMYHAAGLPDDFIAEALATVPSEIWFPSHDQLRQAKAVDKFVDPGQFAVSGIAYWTSPGEVDQILREDNLYGAIYQHDAKAYAQVQGIFLTGARLGRRITDVEDDASDVIADQYLPFYVRKAEDAPLLRYQRAYVAKLEYMTAHNPLPCAASAFPELALPRSDPDYHLPESIKRDLEEALADIINSSFDQPHAPDASGAVYQARMHYFRRLNAKEPSLTQIFDNPAASRQDPAALCNAVTVYYRDILDQPSSEAAIILRDFLGNAS